MKNDNAEWRTQIYVLYNKFCTKATITNKSKKKINNYLMPEI